MAGSLAATSPALADIDPLSGIAFVRITHAGNAPWAGNGTLNDRAIGRGGVDYEYRIGRFEVTTSQWVEFFNAAYDRPANDRLPHLIPPDFWGAVGTTPNTPGGLRWQEPAGNEMRPVGDISWRIAAMYCNWLHNDRGTNREAFLSGAYDTSTFGENEVSFTDQLARSPGARYFIPTWDEQLKATHFDPNRFGEEQPGWWIGPYGSNSLPSGGPPGVGEANYGWSNGPWSSVPLGSYSLTTPWGLYDASAATSEWSESYLESPVSGLRWRIFDGSHWGSSPGDVARDQLYRRAAEFPNVPTYEFGLRIAASVPSAGTCTPVEAAILWLARRRRRFKATEKSPGIRDAPHERDRDCSERAGDHVTV